MQLPRPLVNQQKRMEKYSRYVDKNGRLFVLLARWCSPKFLGTGYSAVPTTVDLLDVEREALVPNLTVEQFDDFVMKNQLQRLKTK